MSGKTTVVHGILVNPEDMKRWRALTGSVRGSRGIGNRLGIRIYLNDKHRWSKIVKIAATEDKKAADVFKELLDLAERKKLYLRGKKAADIFKYLLDMYERERLLWGQG